ncbi:MAG: hypothetical protein JWL59_3554 [Chthoniobacteraceae bacterium]|nr:hypothetical protein [Chthoniobacteraceae bacterium]
MGTTAYINCQIFQFGNFCSFGAIDMEILKFVFSSFWHFVGSVILLVIACHTVIIVAHAIFVRPEK